MKSIIIYQIDELKDEARKNAINELRNKVYENESELDWADARETQSRIEKLSGVKVDIQQNSHGYYYKILGKKYLDLALEENHQKWEDFVKAVKEDNITTWADDLYLDVLENTEFDDDETFAEHVAETLCQLAKDIEYHCLDYLEDNYVIEYAIENNLYFTQSGNLCKE